MIDTIVIGISDQKISTSPSTLVTYALGSCVGIMLHDSSSHIGGMAHIMLPDSNLMKGQVGMNRMKFADTAIVNMLNAMIALGAIKSNITAKITGGANMFQVSDDFDIGSIGTRNVSSVKKVLKELNIPIVAEDTGEDFGRTVFFDLDTGAVRVQALGKDIKEI